MRSLSAAFSLNRLELTKKHKKHELEQPKRLRFLCLFVPKNVYCFTVAVPWVTSDTTSRASVATRCNVSFTKTSAALPAPIASTSMKSNGPDPLNDALPLRLEIDIKQVPDASMDGVKSGAPSPEVGRILPAVNPCTFTTFGSNFKASKARLRGT